MDGRRRIAALALLVAGSSACYTTKINTQMSGPPTGPEYEHRQWFTLGGLLPISSEVGRECPDGVSEATSRQGGVDILIGLGLSLTGILVSGAVCNLPLNPTSDDVASYSLCRSVVSGLPPLLFGSRTVTYRCRS